jgi:carbon-monoxide dehydrogenase small subunit
MIRLDFTLNGDAVGLDIPPDRTLLQLLRRDLGLLGTKENCLEAECGVCSVLLDGRVVNSCILLAAQVQGRQVVTIEGLGTPEHLHPIQQAFLDHGAVQCGYCIPGMVLTAKSWLDEHPGRVPDEAEIREALAGTLCRCTGYQKIVDAVAAAAASMARG